MNQKENTSLELLSMLLFLKELDVSTIRSYQDELQLHQVIKQVTNEQVMSLEAILNAIYQMDQQTATELMNTFEMTSKQIYANEILIALNKRSNGIETWSESDLEEGVDRFALIELYDLGKFLFRELRFSDEDQIQTNDIIINALKEDHIQMIKAFYTNDELNIHVRNYYNDTLLHLAVLERSLKTIDFLIEVGLDVDAINDFKQTPLHYAVYHVYHDVVQLLMDHGAKVDVQNDEGDTPLHLAIEKKNMEMIKRILRGKPNLKLKNELGLTPLDVAIRHDDVEIIKAIDQVNSDFYKLCGFEDPYYAVATFNAVNVFHYLQAKPIPCKVNDKEGVSPLHNTAIAGHMEITKCLLECGLDLNVKTKLGITPLHNAVVKNQIDMVKFLIESGAKIDEQTKDGLTPLYYAVVYKHYDLIELLLGYQADINCAASDNGAVPLHDATYMGDLKLTRFLVERGATINIQSKNGTTPLHNAIIHEHLDVVYYLVEQGANLILQNKDHNAALELACLQENNQLIDMFLSLGSQLQHYKPLYLACLKGNNELVNQLLEHGADVNQGLSGYDSLLHIAIQRKNNELVSLFLDYGANVNKMNQWLCTPMIYSYLYRSKEGRQILRQNNHYNPFISIVIPLLFYGLVIVLFILLIVISNYSK